MRRRDLMFGAIGFALVPAGASAARPEAARDFVAGMADQTKKVIVSTPEPEMRALKLASMLREGLAFDAMAQYVLGRSSRDLSAAQISTFTHAFERHVIDTYADLLSQQTEWDVKITGTSEQPGGDVLVSTQVVRPGAQPVGYDWRIRQTSEGMKVVDVVIAGVSLLITRRQEFASVIRRDGIDGLIRRLQNGMGT